MELSGFRRDVLKISDERWSDFLKNKMRKEFISRNKALKFFEQKIDNYEEVEITIETIDRIQKYVVKYR